MLRVLVRQMLGGKVYDPNPRGRELGPEVPPELEAECRRYPASAWAECGSDVAAQEPAPEVATEVRKRTLDGLSKGDLLELCDRHQVRAKRGRRFGSNASVETLLRALRDAGVVLDDEAEDKLAEGGWTA